MHLKRIFRNAVAGGGLLFALAAAADPVTDAARMLESGDAQGAWRALSALEAERTGDPAFDLLLGRAALAADRPAEALFAFERAAAVSPEDATVQLWMARAFLAVRDLRSARRALDTARSRGLAPGDVPEAEALEAELYAAVRAPEGFTGYIEGFAGYDTNVNAATDESTINVGGRNATLDPRGVSQEDVFLGIAGRLNYRRHLTAKTDLEAGGYVNERINTSEDDFSIATLAGHAGVKHRDGANTWAGAVKATRYLLDHDGYLTSLGLGGAFERRISRNGRARAFAEVARLSYDDQSVRDANRLIAGAGYDHAFAGAARPTLGVTAYGGTVDETSSGVPHLGYDLYGARLAGVVTINPRTTAFAVAQLEHRSYGGPVPGFLTDRDDDQYSARGGVNFEFARNWRVTPEVTYVRNDSNTSVNDYDRIVTKVSLRRSFD